MKYAIFLLFIFLFSCSEDTDKPAVKGYQITQSEKLDKSDGYIRLDDGWVLQTSVLKDGWSIQYWNVILFAVTDSVRAAEIQKAKDWIAWHKTIRDTIFSVE